MEGGLKLLRTEAMPHMWCAGCGNGIVLGCLLRAMERRGLTREKTVVVTGIGCFGKADDYIDTNAVHGTHGRALPIATGIKAHNPDLTVIALMGDGDCATIGGNHLLHAARRNIGVVAVVANNRNYGMTGGQASATTPVSHRTVTSVFGNPEDEMDLCRVAAAAGGSFVGRATVYHASLAERLISQAFDRQGFSFIEIMSACPVYYGRMNGFLTPAAMLQYWRDVTVTSTDPGPEPGRIPIGVIVDEPRPEFTQRYRELRARAIAPPGLELTSHR